MIEKAPYSGFDTLPFCGTWLMTRACTFPIHFLKILGKSDLRLTQVCPIERRKDKT